MSNKVINKNLRNISQKYSNLITH